MHPTKMIPWVLAVAASLSLTACSTPSANQTTAATTSSASSASPATASTATPAALKASVPSLQVKLQCKDCEVSPEVQKAILTSYEQAALKAGVRIANDSQATLTITNYSSRGLAKFLLGPLAVTMTDEIKATVSGGTREFQVEENARMIFRNIESVARAVGQEAFNGLAKL